MRVVSLACVSVLLLAMSSSLSSIAFAADPPAPPKGMSIGDVAPAFEAIDIDGRPFALAKAREIKADEALASVNAAAKAAGAKDSLKPEDGLDKVPGLKADTGLDAAKTAAFGCAAGRPWGLVATADSATSWKTIGDVSKWIETSAEAPILFLCWSSQCPTSKLYEERILEAVARTGSRLYCLACGANDPDEDIRAYLKMKELPFRVLLDHDQKITDVLGGRRTPHAFVFDAKNKLAYTGTIDNDAAQEKEEAARIPYLKAALESAKEGKGADILVTAPVG